MSGVVDSDGQQWEHCHTCAEFVRFPQNLGYKGGSLDHICIKCVNKLPQEELEAVIPAPEWLPQYEEPESELGVRSGSGTAE